MRVLRVPHYKVVGEDYKGIVFKGKTLYYFEDGKVRDKVQIKDLIDDYKFKKVAKIGEKVETKRHVLVIKYDDENDEFVQVNILEKELEEPKEPEISTEPKVIYVKLS